MKRIEYRFRHPIAGCLILGLALVVVTSFCLNRPDQSDIERRILREFSRAWDLHRIVASTNAPVTNVLQVFEESPIKYPYAWHEQLRVFGPNAGFERSVGEKYVFLQPPLKTQRGEIMVMNGPFR